MADPRFFTAHGPFRLAELARIAEARLAADADGDAVFRDVAPLESAGASDVSFLDNRHYIAAFSVTKAGACVVAPDLAGKAPPGMAVLISDEPYKSYALIATAFYPETVPEPEDPDHPIHPSAKIGEGTRIGPGAVIGPRAEIGRRCRIGACAVIGAGVVVGDDAVIGPHASLSHCLLGARVTIEAGARIGQEGFGFATSDGVHIKIPQLGRVIIHDDVGVGANTTIDRGSGPDTVIGPGCMIDNLVQIGHNLQLGRGCVIAAQVGFAGSTKLDDYVAIGGQAGFAGHLKIGRGARIAAKSGVMKDIPPGETYGGFPAVPIRQWHRQNVTAAQLADGKRKGK
jgi:UDP-3-O-[3-hydroxymyristoyl] glucosamine N-acyltransferase